MGHAPKIPPAPPPSQQELELISKQTQALDKYLQSIDAAKASADDLTRISQIASGVYDPVFDDKGNLTGTKINQERITNLGLDAQMNEKIGKAQAETYLAALNGTLPVSAATLESKKQEFRLLKETASRRGINIAGDTPEEAAANPQDSTAASEAVKGFTTKYGLIEDQERRGNFSMGYQPLGTQAVTFAGNGAAAASSSGAGYAGAITAAGQIMQPFQADRNLQFQVGYGNALNRAQQRSDIAGLIAKGAGTAAGVYAAGAGGGGGGATYAS